MPKCFKKDHKQAQARLQPQPALKMQNRAQETAQQHAKELERKAQLKAEERAKELHAKAEEESQRHAQELREKARTEAQQHAAELHKQNQQAVGRPTGLVARQAAQQRTNEVVVKTRATVRGGLDLTTPDQTSAERGPPIRVQRLYSP